MCSLTTECVLLQALTHIYMTTAATTPCGGQRCLTRDYVDVVVNDLGVGFRV